jgi:MFS family permease
MILITPSAFLPDILLDHFDGSYPLSAISTGVADSLGGIFAFIMSPTFGRWADTYGRKPVIMFLSVLGFLPIVCLTLSVQMGHMIAWIWNGMNVLLTRCICVSLCVVMLLQLSLPEPLVS